VPGLGAPSLPAPYQQGQCRDLLQECVPATQPDYAGWCQRSVLPFGALSCSFPTSPAFAKIGPVLGPASGWRPGTHSLEGALGFCTSPFAVNSSRQSDLNCVAVTGQIHCFSWGLSTFLCLTLTAVEAIILLARTLVKFLTLKF